MKYYDLKRHPVISEFSKVMFDKDWNKEQMRN